MIYNTTKLFLYSAFGAVLFALVLSMISDKLLIKSIKAKYPKEELIYNFKTSIALTIMMPFATGSFMGACAIPFLLSNALSEMTLFQKISFIWLCLMLPLVIFANIMVLMRKVIATNKRIISTSFFKFKWWKVNFEFLLSDIKSMSWNDAYNHIDIVLKNDEMYTLGGTKSAKQCYEKVRNLLDYKEQKEQNYDNRAAN